MTEVRRLLLALTLLSACSGSAKEPETAFHTCGPQPADCRSLLSQTVGKPPLKDPPAMVGSYAFYQGERQTGSRNFAYLYRSRASGADELTLALTQRQPGGSEPPSDLSASPATPGGVHYIERSKGQDVTGLDFWSENLHFVISFQGSIERASEEYQAGVALIDSMG